MLVINDLETGYGKKQVLFGLSMEVRKGGIVALIGPNGAGKSTALKAICGLIPIWNGKILFNGSHIHGFKPAQIFPRGITFVPQGSRVFHGLSVKENLEVGGIQLAHNAARARIEHVLESFPALKKKLRQDAGKLSGGEQQMLALARGLMPEPKLLILDEPSLGLSPKLAGDVFKKIVELNTDRGMTILIVEQKVREVLQISERVYGIKHGRTVFEGESKKVAVNQVLLKEIFL